MKYKFWKILILMINEQKRQLLFKKRKTNTYEDDV